jgi:hypothetical protein
MFLEMALYLMEKIKGRNKRFKRKKNWRYRSSHKKERYYWGTKKQRSKKNHFFSLIHKNHPSIIKEFILTHRTQLYIYLIRIHGYIRKEYTYMYIYTSILATYTMDTYAIYN